MKGQKRKASKSNHLDHFDLTLPLAVSSVSHKLKFVPTFKEVETDGSRKVKVTGMDVMSNALLVIGPQRTKVKVMKELLEMQSPLLKSRLSDVAAASSLKKQNVDWPVLDPEGRGVEDMQVFYFKDIDPAPFKDFLKYLYSLEPTWSPEMVTVTKDGDLGRSILLLKCLVHKLGVKDLEDQIEFYLTAVTSSNDDVNGKLLAQLFQGAIEFELEDLKNKIMSTILRSPHLIFKDVENYKFLTRDNLKIILVQLDQIKPLELFQIVERWSEAQHKNENFNLAPLFHSLQFKLKHLTLDQFMSHVYPTRLLDESLVGQLFPILFEKSHVTKSITPTKMVPESKTRIQDLPPRILLKIIKYLNQKDLRSCRQVSKNLKFFIETEFPLEIKLKDETLEKLNFWRDKYNPHYFHPYRRLSIFLENLKKDNCENLLHFLQFSKYNRQFQNLSNSTSSTLTPPPDLKMQLNIFHVSSKFALMALLKRIMGKAGNLKISLKIGRLAVGPKDKENFSRKSSSSSSSSSNESDSEDESDELNPQWIQNSLQKFDQVTSLQFDYLNRSTELDCLIQLTRQCPNLNLISIGNFTRRTRCLDSKQTANLVKFLNESKLNKVNLSIANLGNSWLTIDDFLELKNEREIQFKKVNLEFDSRIKTLKFVNIFSECLEEIYDFEICPLAPIKFLRNYFPHLTTLTINCSVQWLLFLLMKTPALQKLFWSELPTRQENVTCLGNCLEWIEDDLLAEKVAPHSKIQLVHLKRLVVSLKREENLQLLKFLALVSSVKSLSFEIVQDKISRQDLARKVWCLYKYFKNLETLEICENEETALQVLTGLKEGELKDFEISKDEYRQPFIGDLKSLRILNLGLLDYQEMATRWTWTVNFAVFTHGIGHLTQLTHLILPPMELNLAKKILKFVTRKIRSLTSIVFQVWADQIENCNDTMTLEDVDDLSIKFGAHFKNFETLQILEDNNVHYTTWI